MARNRNTTRSSLGDGRRFRAILLALVIILILLIAACMFKTCNSDCGCDQNDMIQRTGYLPDNEDWDNIPDVIPPYDEDDLKKLGDKVMLEHLFPPIGDQGSKGTCVAWAIGYNLKTALNAKDNGWTKEQLDDPINQTSPADLWLSIPLSDRDNPRGPCWGTTFDAAFSTLISDGAVSMQEAPYANLGNNCTAPKRGNPENKLMSFSRIVSDTDMPNVEQIKAYLNDSIPLAFGAKLGNKFNNWRGSDVMRSDIFNPSGEHAYHAMALSGYDDEKNAFRVRNSWGEDWGDQGSIWVDYDFFCTDFCFAVFVAENLSEGTTISSN